MVGPTSDMMSIRRTALDLMADLPAAGTPRRPFAGIRVDVRHHIVAHGPIKVTRSLVEAVSTLLMRGSRSEGLGAALVAGLAAHLDVKDARLFNEELFGEVWDDFRMRSGEVDPDSDYRIKTKVTADGAIPPDLYGSNWSFKHLHMDREALLFSHVYGPVAGFTGGALVLVDVRAYMRRHKLRFNDVFEWSEEPTPGSKPVLRMEYHGAAVADCGIDLGAIGHDVVLFVNNSPGAGILHGVTPVAVTNRAAFVREFHRCSVKEAG